MRITNEYTVSIKELKEDGKYDIFMKQWGFLTQKGTLKQSKTFIWLDMIKREDEECIILSLSSIQAIYGDDWDKKRAECDPDENRIRDTETIK